MFFIILSYLKYCALFVFKGTLTTTQAHILFPQLFKSIQGIGRWIACLYSDNFGYKSQILTLSLQKYLGLTINFLRIERENDFINVLIVYTESFYKWYNIFFLYYFWLMYSQYQLWPDLDMKSTVLLINNHHHLPPHQNVNSERILVLYSMISAWLAVGYQ